MCYFDERSANLSFRPAQRGEIFCSSSGFSLRSKRHNLLLKRLVLNLKLLTQNVPKA